MAVLAIALVIASFMVGQASERDEASLTVQVSSADHEMEEGYFSLGDTATVMVKPGSDLYRFLSRKRGQLRPDNACRIQAARNSRPSNGELRRVGAAPSPCLYESSSRSMTSPTMLFGVEAPAVNPTITGPARQPVRGS